MKLVLKGIETREDARLAREHGVDGIVVSNHGGRALDTNRSTIEALSEVVDGAGAGSAGVRRRRLPARHRHLQGARAWARAPWASAGRTCGASAPSASRASSACSTSCAPSCS